MAIVLSRKTVESVKESDAYLGMAIGRRVRPRDKPTIRT